MADNLWRSLGSIVGIGVGSMDLLLVRANVRPGDTVHGRLVLKLSEPTEAKRLVVGVEATETRERLISDGRGGRTRANETRTLHRFEQQLDGKRSYQADAYDLHLPIPPDAVRAVKAPEGTLGDVLRVVSAFVDVGPRPITWQVYAFLDIPWKANIKQQTQIAVQPR